MQVYIIVEELLLLLLVQLQVERELMLCGDEHCLSRRDRTGLIYSLLRVQNHAMPPARRIIMHFPLIDFRSIRLQVLLLASDPLLPNGKFRRIRLRLHLSLVGNLLFLLLPVSDVTLVLL